MMETVRFSLNRRRWLQILSFGFLALAASVGVGTTRCPAVKPNTWVLHEAGADQAVRSCGLSEGTRISSIHDDEADVDPCRRRNRGTFWTRGKGHPQAAFSGERRDWASRH